jgi:hypothetical protein
LADGWGAPLDRLREAAANFAARDEQPVAASCRALLRRAGVAVPHPGRTATDLPAARENHVASVLAKTGCRRRAQLAGYLRTLTG